MSEMSEMCDLTTNDEKTATVTDEVSLEMSSEMCQTEMCQSEMCQNESDVTVPELKHDLTEVEATPAPASVAAKAPGKTPKTLIQGPTKAGPPAKEATPVAESSTNGTDEVSGFCAESSVRHVGCS
jgi:hypothetical protein